MAFSSGGLLSEQSKSSAFSWLSEIGSGFGSIRTRGLLAAALVTCAGAQNVSADLLATFSASDVPSVTGLGGQGNTILSYTYTGPKAKLTDFIVPAGAQLREVIGSTFGTDAYIRVSSGTTALYDMRPISTGNYNTTTWTSANKTFTLPTPMSINTGTQFQFEFFEMTDDGPGVDQRWTSISFEFHGSLFGPPAASNLAVGGTASALLPGQTLFWYQVDITTSGVYQFDTLGSNMGPSDRGFRNDTELALYDASGHLLASNDDISGSVYMSQINQMLSPGTYYLAAGGNNSTFAEDFIATSSANQTGTMKVNVSAVPEPASVMLLAVAGVAALRRRKM